MSRNKLLKKADEYVNNLSIGLGRGFSNQLEGVLSMIESPVQTAKGFAALASNPSQIPGMVRNALTETVSRGTSGPMGLGEVIGENLGPSTFRRAPVMRDITVYHGSPHRINNVTPEHPLGQFDASRIGTGEGAQAFGHGIYFAENPKVAGTYRFAGTGIDPDSTTYGGRSVTDLYDQATKNQDRAFRLNDPQAIKQANAELYFWESLMTRKHPDAAIAEFSDPSSGWPELVSFTNGLKRDSFNIPKAGHLYTVDLPDEYLPRMLDSDKPLTGQPPAVKEALKKSGLWADYKAHMSDYSSPQGTRGAGKGGNFYEYLSWKMGSPDKASEHLNSLGIPGIRYLDGFSRDTKRGTRNYVVFDPSITTILNRE